MPKPARRSFLPPLAAGLVATAVLSAACLFPPPLAAFLDMKVYDSFVRASSRRPPTGRVAVVDVDEGALARYGQWPWPRYRVAALLSRIREAGASVVAVDMVFPEADRASLSRLSEEILRDFRVRVSLGNVPREAMDGDRTLAETLSGGPFVLGYQFDFVGGGGEDRFLHPLPFAVRSRGKGAEGQLFDAPGVVASLPVLSSAAPSSGFFNVIPDPDGVLRRVPATIRHRGRLYPSLALAAYLRLEGGDGVVEGGPDGVESLRLGGRSLPLDRKGNLVVAFRGPRRTFPHLSAAALLDGSAPPGALAGKVVLLGTSAAGLGEIRTTPLDAAHPGPEIHATVVDNLLAGDAVSFPRWAKGLQLLLVAAFGAIVSAVSSRARAPAAIAAAAAIAAGSWGASAWLLSRHGIFLSPVLPSFAAALSFTCAASLRFALAERDVRERERMLARTQDAIIQSLASLAETRHQETGGHILRTRHYMRALALALRKNPRYRPVLDDGTVDLLYRLAPLHDIGKVGVRDSILLKPESLTEAEYDEMKRHTLYGSETIRIARGFLGEDSFLAMADDIVRTHQERWDGGGYPEGLAGEAIPLSGRLMAVADVYDAMISERGYKGAIPHDEAIRRMVSERGSHFDPDVVDALLEVQEEFREIAARFSGKGVEPEPPPVRPRPGRHGM